MSTELTDELVEHIFANLDGSRLSDWEVDFIRSVKAYWKKYHKLSDKQKKRLAEVWEESKNVKRVFRKPRTEAPRD